MGQELRNQEALYAPLQVGGFITHILSPLAATNLIQHQHGVDWNTAGTIWEQSAGNSASLDDSQIDTDEERDEHAAEEDADEIEVDAETPHDAFEQPDADDDHDVHSEDGEDFTELSDEDFAVSYEAGDEVGDRFGKHIPGIPRSIAVSVLCVTCRISETNQPRSDCEAESRPRMLWTKGTTT
ncbi:hypothetical protein V8E36_003709 [Tilletia maclaganii]